MNFSDYELTDQRLCMIRFLNEQGNKSLNESLLHSAVRGLLNISRAQIREQIKWLDEAGLVDIDEIQDILVAVLTNKGIDVANGDTTVEGVLPAAKVL